MVRCSRFFLAIIATLGLLLPAQAASSDTAARPASLSARALVPASESPISSSTVITGTPAMTGTIRIATLLASYFNRQVQEILALHGREIGFGCVVKALYIAAEAGVPLEQVLDMRQQDVGWGEIRQALGLPAKTPQVTLGQIISQGRGHKGPDWLPPGQAKKAGKSVGKGLKGQQEDH